MCGRQKLQLRNKAQARLGQRGSCSSRFEHRIGVTTAQMPILHPGLSQRNFQPTCLKVLLLADGTGLGAEKLERKVFQKKVRLKGEERRSGMRFLCLILRMDRFLRDCIF